jgi:hypothetical protein
MPSIMALALSEELPGAIWAIGVPLVAAVLFALAQDRRTVGS